MEDFGVRALQWAWVIFVSRRWALPLESGSARSCWECRDGARPRYHARRKFGYRDESLSSRYNSRIVTIGYHGFLRTALSHRYNDWMCVHHVHSL